MKRYKIQFEISAETPETVGEIGKLLARVTSKVDHDELITLLKAVNKTPGIVKKALLFI
jgi:hypothetical protein